MVRRQDEECDKTYEFLRGVMQRLRYLGRERDGVAVDHKSSSLCGDEPEGGMLTYLEMRRSLLRLGFTWNRSLPSSTNDDDISIVSEASRSSRVSGASGRVLGGKQRKKRDVVGSDNQLILLLSVLVEMEERWRAENGAGANVKTAAADDSSCSDLQFTKGLYLPELMQAYKLVIGGMQALQSLDHRSKLTSDGPSPSLFTDMELSERIRERTKCLLRSFGPNHIPSRELLLPLSPYSKSASGKRRDGLLSSSSSPSSSSPSKKLFTSPRKLTPSDTLALQPTKPRLAEDSIRKLMHTKDATLAKIVEEHEVEIDAMVQDMNALKEKESDTRLLLRQKRRRTRLLAGMGLILLVSTGVYWEYHRREWVRLQIARGREEERQHSRVEIEQLTRQMEVIQTKLDTAEGRARYQHSRSYDLELAQNQSLEEIASMEQKWWLDQAEMGRCRTAVREKGEEIETLRDSVKELEEEEGWCSNRLKGRDAELNSLRYAKTNDGDDGDGRVVNRAAAAMVSLHTATTTEQQQQLSHKRDIIGKPVKLEMKYNQSVRNAMILRQVYSGAGGVAASVVLRVIFPQAFSLLAISAGTAVTPTAKKAVAVAPKKLLMNVKWVDRIHAATVVLLVVRTAVLFFMP